MFRSHNNQNDETMESDDQSQPQEDDNEIINLLMKQRTLREDLI